MDNTSGFGIKLVEAVVVLAGRVCPLFVPTFNLYGFNSPLLAAKHYCVGAASILRAHVRLKANLRVIPSRKFGYKKTGVSQLRFFY